MDQRADFAFSSNTLNRAAERRGEADELFKSPQAKIILLWRGKILVNLSETALHILRSGHPVIATKSLAPLFLGITDDAPVFAVDISGWNPQDGNTGASFIDTSTQTHPDLPNAGFVDLRANLTNFSAEDAEMAATARAMLEWHESHQFCAKCGHASESEQGGWQRYCPSCEARHFPRTDPVVIMLVTRGNSTLIGRSPGWPEGVYSCLAGFVEPGETIEAAVRREVHEETGIHIGRVTYAASQPWPFPMSLMIGCVAEADSDEITLDPAELEDALWITREDMVSVFANTHPTVKPARKGAIAHFLIRKWLEDRL